jgi:hypothetical protein
MDGHSHFSSGLLHPTVHLHHVESIEHLQDVVVLVCKVLMLWKVLPVVLGLVCPCFAFQSPPHTATRVYNADWNSVNSRPLPKVKQAFMRLRVACSSHAVFLRNFGLFCSGSPMPSLAFSFIGACIRCLPGLSTAGYALVIQLAPSRVLKFLFAQIRGVVLAERHSPR